MSFPSPSPRPTPTTGASQEVVVLLPAAPDSLNPLYARAWPSRALQDLFLTGLWRMDDRLRLVPELASEVPTRAGGDISDEGQTLTIHLRPEAVWSDGCPLTAEDAAFTYQMAVAEGNQLPSRFPYVPFVNHVAAAGAHTVQVHFSRPFAPWPTTLFSFVLPQHVLAPVLAEDGTLDRAVWNQAPRVGSGPFVYAGEEEGGLVFLANARYWRAVPALGRLRVEVVSDPVARWAQLTEGTAHLAPFLWPEVPPESTVPDGTVLLTSPSGYVETLFFNLDPRRGHPALQDVRVRTAVAGAIDRNRVCSLLEGGWAEPAATLLSGTVFEDPTLETPLPAAAEAAALLDQAGWQDLDGDGVREQAGVPLVLRYAVPPEGSFRAAAQTAVAQMLGEVGMGVQPVPPGAGQPWEDPSGWDLGQWAEQPPGYPDPDDPRWLCAEARPGGQNPAGLCDEGLDQLLVSQATTVDPDDRMALQYQIQTLARQQAWWVPLCRWEDIWVVSVRLTGTRPWRGAPFWNVWEWRLQ